MKITIVMFIESKSIGHPYRWNDPNARSSDPKVELTRYSRSICILPYYEKICVEANRPYRCFSTGSLFIKNFLDSLFFPLRFMLWISSRVFRIYVYLIVYYGKFWTQSTHSES